MINWFKKWGWVLFLTLIVVGGGVLFFLIRRKKSVHQSDLAERARERIVEIETEILIERSKIEAQTDAELDALSKIEKMDEGIEKRKALADFLNEML